MNYRSRWKDASRRVIESALAEGRRLGLSDKDLVKHVDASYPFNERAMHPYRCWLAVRKRMLGSLLPKGQGRPDQGGGLDRDYFARLDGPGSPAWEAMLVRKRAELHAAGIEADDWEDQAVADWRPGAKEGAGDGR